MKVGASTALLAFISLLGLGCPRNGETASLTPEQITALNSAPQTHYPELPLGAQRAAMRRLEQRRRNDRVPELRKKIPPAEWIAVAYHGLVLDANFDVITLDPPTVAAMQESLYAILRQPARERVTAKYGGDPELLFRSGQLDVKERATVREAVLDTLLKESDPEIRERYEWRHRLIARGARGAPPANVRPELRDLLRQFQLEDVPEQAAEPTYVEQCRAGEVPIPPGWPDARWISQGPLALVLISTNYSAEVFAYKDPTVPGVCYALPRRDSSGSIQLLGIICQSSTTGKACFWDNKNRDNTQIQGKDITLDIDAISNGLTLDENCTNCHRGENAFIIHPGTPLQLSRAGAAGGPYVTRTAVRYAPIGQSGWSNPGSLTLAAPSTGQSECTSCHDLPETQPKNFYCQSVLWGAALETMPPQPPRAGWPPTINPEYTDHITQLSACP